MCPFDLIAHRSNQRHASVDDDVYLIDKCFMYNNVIPNWDDEYFIIYFCKYQEKIYVRKPAA